MFEFKLNGKAVRSNSEGDTPLLWVLRNAERVLCKSMGCRLARVRYQLTPLQVEKSPQ